MPIYGKTDIETLDFRYTKTPIQVFKGDVKGASRPGANLKEQLRIHIATEWLRDAIGYGTDHLCKEIPIYLAYPKPDETFPTYNKEFSLSGLETVCDGRNILQQSKKITTPDKGVFRRLLDVSENIPCARFTETGELPECPKGCKGMGTLYFYLQSLQAIAPFQLASLTTVHSAEVPTIAKQLLDFSRKFGSLTDSPFPYPETFGKIPFILRRLESKSKKPQMSDGKRTGTTREDKDWPITLTVDPLWYQRFLLWEQYMQAAKRGTQLPQAVMQQLGFVGDGSALKSADAEDRALPPAPSEEEAIKRGLIRDLGAKLKELNKSPTWAREMAYKLFGVTSPEGGNLSTKLSIAQLRDFLVFLHSEKVEQYVETYAHNYQEFQNVEAVEVEIDESEEVERIELEPESDF